MFAKLIVGLFVISIVFAIAMYPWVTDDDISNLPKEPFARFTSLVYFSVTTFTSTGYGDIAPKSTRAKMVMSMYMAVAFAGALVVATQWRKS